MRKKEHEKIIKEFNDNIKKLELRIHELKIESDKNKIDAKINLFIANQKRDVIDKMMELRLKDMNYFSEYDEKVRHNQKQICDRINMDNEKFELLKKYIIDAFPKFISNGNETMSIESKSNKELSKTYIGPEGQVYTPFHIIDIAILIMKTQIKKLNDIFGENNLDSN